MYNYFSTEYISGIKGYFKINYSSVNSLYSGQHQTKLSGNNLEFSEYKQYNQGEDIKHIDWKIYAKSDKLYIKKYEQENVLNCSIFFDTSLSMNYKSYKTDLTKLEYGKIYIANIILKIIQNKDFFDIYSFDNKLKLLNTLTNSLSSISILNKKFNEIQADKKSNLKNIFGYIRSLKLIKKTIIILTDLIEEGNSLDYIKQIADLKLGGNNIILIHLLDHLEINLDLKDKELYNFIDLETKNKILSNPEQIKDKYNNLMKEYINNLRKNLNHYNINYILVDTSVDIRKNLKVLFK